MVCCDLIWHENYWCILTKFEMDYRESGQKDLYLSMLIRAGPTLGRNHRFSICTTEAIYIITTYSDQLTNIIKFWYAHTIIVFIVAQTIGQYLWVRIVQCKAVPQLIDGNPPASHTIKGNAYNPAHAILYAE